MREQKIELVAKGVVPTENAMKTYPQRPENIDEMARFLNAHGLPKARRYK